MHDELTVLRPAKPEVSDGILFAQYLDQAAEGFFRFMLGSRVEEIISKAFIEPGHSLSYENVLFAERNGVVAGMSSSYTGIRHRGFTEEPLKRAAGRAAVRMMAVRILLAPLWRILETVPDEEYYLQGIAVDPELRGAGIGSLLMDDVEARAKASNSSRLGLHVSAKNEGARRLYERRGFRDLSEWPSPKRLPTIFVRMVKEL